MRDMSCQALEELKKEIENKPSEENRVKVILKADVVNLTGTIQINEKIYNASYNRDTNNMRFIITRDEFTDIDTFLENTECMIDCMLYLYRDNMTTLMQKISCKYSNWSGNCPAFTGYDNMITLTHFIKYE